MAIQFTDDFNGAGAATNLGSWTDNETWTITGAANGFVVQTNGNLRFNRTVGDTVGKDSTANVGGWVEFTTPTSLGTDGSYFVALRLQDVDNFIGLQFAGAGGAGGRFCSMIAGALTDTIHQFQLVVSTTYRLEDDGTDIKLYSGSSGGTGGTLLHTYNDSTNFVSETGKGVVVNNDGVGTNVEVITAYSSGTVGGGGDTISITEKEVGEVVQRTPATNNASVTIAGTYAGTPTTIEYRILDAADDTTEIVTWTTLDAAPTGGTFSESVTVPANKKWYHAEVRYSNDTGVTDLQVNDWGVGSIIACWGQSNIENWFTDFTGTTTGFASRYFGSAWAKQTNTGVGAVTFGNKIALDLDVVVGLIDSGKGGTQLGGGIEWGSDTGGSTYDDAIQALSAVGNKCEFVLWVQGEADAVVGTTEANYTTDLNNLITSRLRATVTNGSDQTNLPFIISQLGRRTDGTDSTTQAIRNALLSVADGATADTYLGATTHDLALADTVHFTSAGYTTHATRMAQAVLNVLGLETFHRGAAITSAFLTNSTTVDVTLSHSGGTDFTPTTAITDFEVFDDATPLTVSAAVRQSATVIRLTVTPAITGTATARYMYGAVPAITGVVLDNSTLNLPLEGSDTFAVSQDHVLLADDLTVAVEISSPAIGETNSLTADDLVVAVEISSPVIGQTHTLLADDLVVAVQVSSPLVDRPESPISTFGLVSIIQERGQGVSGIIDATGQGTEGAI